MTEFELIYNSFMGFMEKSTNYAKVDDKLIHQYQGVFMDAKNETVPEKHISQPLKDKVYRNGDKIYEII